MLTEIDDDRKAPTVHQLGGTIHNVRRLADPNEKRWTATNLSVAHHKSTGYIGMLRSSNYMITPTGAYEVQVESTIRSEIYIAPYNVKTHKLGDLHRLDVSKIADTPLRRGLEDPKLFYRDNAWHFTCVTMEKGHTPFARMAICRLSDDLKEIVSFEKFPGIDAHRPEKNWMLPDEPNPNFDWIYGSNAIVKDDVLTVHMNDDPTIATLRGNTNLLDLGDGTYLAVVHRLFTRLIMNNKLRFYVHYFAKYDSTGKIIALSRGFKFERSGVEFAAGLSICGDDFMVSYGSNDESSHVALLPKATVLAGLLPVNK